MGQTNTYRQQIAASDTSAALVGVLNKGLGTMERAISSDDIRALGWHLLREDLSLPTAVLYEDRLAHNLRWMQDFAFAYGVKLAPHGKTTMAPKLFMRQLEAGAWGITLATAHQTRVAYDHGIRRILMANQLIGRQNMLTIARLLEDPEFEYFCLVDCAEQVDLLGRFFKSQGKKLNVLVELGPDGGRTGVRNRGQLRSLLESLSTWREHIALCGVEVYEGVLKDEPSIRALLNRAVDLLKELADERPRDRNPMILSGAGSAWYDVVADVFSKVNIGQVVDLVLRPGCYLTHDVGAYRAAQAQIESRNSVARNMQPSLQPALQVWAYVQSLPEPEKAIIALGKRDAAFDSGLPTPKLHYRPGSEAPTAVPENWELTHMMDQHAYMKIADADDVQVGDMIGFDISHPCLTFDKWRCLPVLDGEYRVIDVVQTFF